MKRIFTILFWLSVAVNVVGQEYYFSVSDSTRVFFSHGNLQFNAVQGTHECADGTTKQGTWRFAEQQWDMIGEDNKNVSETYDGWIDMFCWGTSGWEGGVEEYQPYSTLISDSAYYPGGSSLNNLNGEFAYADWGVYNYISNDETSTEEWRTITMREIIYLMSSRANASSKSGIGNVNGVNGLVLLPDNWILPNGLPSFNSGASGNFLQNTYSISEWAMMESNGAIFFPANGRRKGTDIFDVESLGYYWSASSAKNVENAHYWSGVFVFDNANVISASLNATRRCYGQSVRLIRDYHYLFDVYDIPNMTFIKGENIPLISISDYCVFEKTVPYSYEVRSSDNTIVCPTIMNDKIGFLSYGTGTVSIEVSVIVEDSTIVKTFNITINPDPTKPEIPCNLSLSSEITNVACNGEKTGKIELAVSGGTEPYYYKWSTGRTSDGLYNVGAGTYSVLVMDEIGCTAEQSFEVSEPVALEISETVTPSTCGGSNGNIEVAVSGGNASYSYSWKNFTETACSLENISAGSYEVTVTDGNSCKQTKTISLADQGAATIAQKTINPSKCNEATGSVEVSVSGGTAPLNYEWSDSASVEDNLYRPKLYSGDYTLSVVDANNCHSVLSVNVPLAKLRQPEIALVSYDDTLKHNIVVWQKENTDDIDQYYIYREIDSLGNYDKIDSLSYSEISVYVDETAQHKKQAYRYEISAMNSCMESPVSKEFKTINLQRKVQDDGAVQLWWNAYEGCEYISYSLYRLTENGSEFMLNLPANKFKYTDEQPKEGTVGYYILIHLSEKIDVSQLLKAQKEPSAYDYIISSIAYIRNDIEKESAEDLNCNAVVYSKDKSIIISNADGNKVFVFDVEGKLVAQRQNVDSAEIPVQTAGVYVVIVGKNVFKVMVE